MYGGLMPRVAAVYSRLSKMNHTRDGLSEAIPRQHHYGAEVVNRKWGDVEIRYYADDDTSATNRKPRPDWERLLREIAAGEVHLLATYNADRLYRVPRDLERLFDVCDDAGLTEMGTYQGDMDLGTDTGRYMARTLGNHAAMASADTSRRLKDMMLHRASKGEPVGGHRAFGWFDKLTPDPVEAPIVQEMVRRFLGGDSLTGLANDLNARAIPTTETRNHQANVDTGNIDRKTGEPYEPKPPKLWASSSVRAVLANPRHAGIPELRRRPGRKRTGPKEVLVSTNAVWPAIISRADHERVLAILNDPGRRAANPPRRTLLTGLAKCSLCSSTLTRGATADGRAVMRCIRTPNNPDACGRIKVAADQLEKLVVLSVLKVMDGPELGRAMAGKADEDDDRTAADLMAAEQELIDLAHLKGTGQITIPEWIEARRGTEGRVKALRAKAGRQRRTAALDDYLGKPGALRAAWDGLPLDRQRAILAATVDSIVVKPTSRPGRRFDDTRVEISWR